MKIARRTLSVFLAMLMLFSVMSIAVGAASVSVKKLNLGYMAPTNSNGTKTIETVKLYGDYDYINFYINSKKKKSFFAYEIYSDKKCTKLVEGDVVYCEKGKYTFTPKIKLKGNYSSKTYYMVTYGAKLYDNGNVSIDKNSMKQFKVVVKRKAAFDDKVVVLKSIKNTTKGPYITWSKLSGANKYVIYRRGIEGTGWTKAGTVSSKKTSFTDTSVKNKNGNYIYSVKAINKKGVSSRYLYSGLVCLFVKAPILSSVKFDDLNRIELNWKSVGSGVKYNIKRKQGDGKWKTIYKNCQYLDFIDGDVKNGETYTYSVEAVLSTEYGDSKSSYYTNSGKKITVLHAPEMQDVQAVENGVKVTWLPVEHATGYSVLRKSLNNKAAEWTLVDKVGAACTSYVDTSPSVTDKAYIYTVRSEGDGFSGNFRKEGMAYIRLQAPYFEVYEEDGAYHFRYHNVPYATAYKAYSRVPGGEWEYTPYGGIDGGLAFPTYGERQVTVVAEYEYYLGYGRGYQVIRSDYSKPYNTVVDYPNLVLSYVVHKDSINLTWKDTGAEGYNVYRKNTADEKAKPQLIASLGATETSYIDKDVEQNVSYTYTVKGIYDGKEQTKDSNPCEIKIYPKETITEKVNAYYAESWGSDYLVIEGDLENAIFYEYKEEDNSWNEIHYIESVDESGKKRYLGKWINFDADNKIKVGVSFLRENGRTGIEDCILVVDKYEPETKITQKSTASGVKVTIYPDQHAVRYLLESFYWDTREFDVKDGKPFSFTLKTKYMDYKGGYFEGDFYITAIKADKNSNTIRPSFYYVLSPILVEAKRNRFGYPVIKWKQDCINEDAMLNIYRKAPGGEWVRISSVKASSVKTNQFKDYGPFLCYFVDDSAKPGKQYTYSIEQEITFDDITVKSAFNETGVVSD